MLVPFDVVLSLRSCEVLFRTYAHACSRLLTLALGGQQINGGVHFMWWAIKVTRPNVLNQANTSSEGPSKSPLADVLFRLTSDLKWKISPMFFLRPLSSTNPRALQSRTLDFQGTLLRLSLA